MRHKLMILSVALFAIAVVGCTKDHESLGDGGNGNGSGSKDMVNEWTVKMLETSYLWNTQVKAKTKDYNLSYDTFFESLLTTTEEDGKHDSKNDYFYSSIEKIKPNSYADGIFETSMGLTFYLDWKLRTDSNTVHEVAAIVVYVQPGSAAAAAKIERGDYIWSVNGVVYKTTKTFYKPLSGESGLATITWSRPSIVGGVETQKYYYDTKLIPTSMEQDPVAYSRVIERAGGAKVGYLLYNQFERGGDTRKYDNKLKDVLRGFKSSGVSHLVLDLRYNGGGYVSSCQLLASMIVPGHMAGDNFMRMTYNEELRIKYGDKNYNEWLKILTLNQMKSTNVGTATGVNLELMEVYIVTTGWSASASEALIHCLRGVGVKVHQIGADTSGKNVGMTLYKSTDAGKSFVFAGNKYEMWPVTFYIKDAKDEKYTSAGFTPGYPNGFYADERDAPSLGVLGDVNETYLKTALYHIDNGRFSVPKRSFSVVRTEKEALGKIDSPHRKVGMKVAPATPY